MLPRLTRLVLALCCAFAAVTATASASTTMELGVADDRLIAESSDPVAQGFVNEWRDNGVDVVRVVARWGAIAPGERSRTKPAGFDGANHLSPGYDWANTDRSVRAARAAGLKVILTVTGWGPLWGSQSPSAGRTNFKPRVDEFRRFATAAATRYRNETSDYIIWNEPNVGQWLQPQSVRSGRSWVPYAPHLYRKIVLATDPAIRQADPGARTHMGALATAGTSGRTSGGNLRPGVFLRAFGCVNSSFRTQRTGSCKGFKRPTANGFAYHPHGRKLAPSSRSRIRDEFLISDLGKLTAMLDRLTRARRLGVRGASRLPLHLTEFGYQTSPPDRQLGVGALTQSKYLQQAASIAARNARVKTLVQYVWRDEQIGVSNDSGWQSGMRYADGRAKPALAKFPIPFWAERSARRKARLWGQVRPGTSHTVTIERRSGSAWRPVATVRTNSRGMFTRTVTNGSRTTYRFRSGAFTSDTRTVSP